MLGENWNRPPGSVIICDDLEDKRNTNTEQLRQELFDWFTKVVVPLRPCRQEDSDYLYGYRRARGRSLNQGLKRTDFKTKRYKALIEEPNQTDLWEKCRSILS
ncbi:hypothetical protein P7H12_26125 [Paenibacillus larvae]|nr:hypothetical protein [Paenibacillus larvae]MDT2266390.1 hypothetical protein [Paenibacillus larvae]